MRTFTSFRDFGRHLQRVAKAVPYEIEIALQDIGENVSAEARAKIGTYQPGFAPPGGGDPFPEWAQLTENTLQEKERLGYAPPDNPLLRTGETRDSISFN